MLQEITVEDRQIELAIELVDPGLLEVGALQCPFLPEMTFKTDLNYPDFDFGWGQLSLAADH